VNPLLVAVALSLALLLPPEARLPERPSAGVARPHIVERHISFGGRRKRQMARYSDRHYGARRWRLRHPPVIVLHFTGGTSWRSAWNHFASNAPARGELPGVCAHYIVGRHGTIREVVPTTIRCRHAIGLNHRSIGVEMVQRTGRGTHWAARRILARRRQVLPTLRLVRWLKRKYDIRMRNIIGHAMANASPYFEDLEGWRNDHVDWRRREVRIFRRRLRRL
jgi:N-acetyl-anhydromuramyl-L-alanine amidase AmpD